MHYMDYREKLGLSVNDSTKVQFFYLQINNFFENLGDIEFSSILEQAFCDRIGAKMEIPSQIVTPFERRPSGLQRAWLYLKDFTDNFPELLYGYVCLINIIPKKQQNIRKTLESVLFQSLENCRLPYDVLRDNDGVFVFPKGAKELDDALVSQPLEWLSSYPKTYKIYCHALRQYSNAEYTRDIADNLRKALEEFLQEILGNNKNLEANKNEICRYLGKQGVDNAISGLFQPLINTYKSVNDRAVKHNDTIDERLLEFLLYQTGVLIRMVLVVKQSEIENSTNTG